MQFISNAFMRFSISAVTVQVSHPYRNIDVIRARSRCILEDMVMLLLRHIGFSLASEEVAVAILIFISVVDLASLVIVAPRYLNWVDIWVDGRNYWSKFHFFCIIPSHFQCITMLSVLSNTLSVIYKRLVFAFLGTFNGSSYIF